MIRIARHIWISVIATMILFGYVSAQESTTASGSDQAEVHTRIDSLAALLKQATDTIDQQQALLEAMMDAQAQQSTSAPQGQPASGQVAAPQQASNMLNPNISLIGDFRGQIGRDFEPDTRAFTLHEAEIGIQAPIDPYARADAFIAVRPAEGIEIEEMYITFLSLPLGLQAKTGKFRSNFGKFNRIHIPETPFSDRPLFTEAYFGEEGLAAVGASAALLIPNPWVYLNLDAEVTAIPENALAFGTVPEEEEEEGHMEEEGHGHGIVTGGRRRDLFYLTRLGTFLDLSESTNLTIGTTYGTGVYDPAGTMRTHIEGIDLTFRWQPVRRAIYQSLLWQTEILFSQRDQPNGGRINSTGMFSYVDWQFLRRWRLGSRYDYTQFPEDSSTNEQGILGSLTFTPSEFSMITLQGRGVRRIDGSWHGVAMLRITFNIGPHGAHPF